MQKLIGSQMGLLGIGSPYFLAFHILIFHFTCLALPSQNEVQEKLLVYDEGE